MRSIRLMGRAVLFVLLATSVIFLVESLTEPKIPLSNVVDNSIRSDHSYKEDSALSYTNRFVTDKGKFLLVTVATVDNAATKRFRRSAWVNQMPLKILGLGLGKHWGGNGQKVQLLKAELEKYKTDHDTIVMFADAHDVLINDGVDAIIQQFKSFNANVVFGAEVNCWPDKSEASKHPQVNEPYPYLNSGIFIGYAPYVYRIVSHKSFPVNGHDQDYYKKIFTDTKLREEINIKLDYRADLFQNLYAVSHEMELRFDGKMAYLYNKIHNRRALCLHGNGMVTKTFVDAVGNYIPNAWNPEDGCTACLEDTISLTGIKEDEFPRVVMTIFIENNSSSFSKLVARIETLSYPKNQIDIFFYCKVASLKPAVDSACARFKSTYKSATCYHHRGEKGTHVRNEGIKECIKRSCDYYFTLDDSVSLGNSDTLKLLIEQNRNVVAPMLLNEDGSRTNFKGASNPRFYPPSMDILKNGRRGLWRVPYVSHCYLIQGHVILNDQTRPLYYTENSTDLHDSFCANLFWKDVDLYVSNRVHFGQLL